MKHAVPSAEVAVFPAAPGLLLSVLGSLDGLRTSEGLDSGLLQIDQALQIVGSDFPVQLQCGARQANRAQSLAAHLRQRAKHMLDAHAGLGDAVIAAQLGCGGRLVLAALALDLHAPALFAQPRFALTINIVLVGQDVAVRIVRIEHVFKVQCVVFTGRAYLDCVFR